MSDFCVYLNYCLLIRFSLVSAILKSSSTDTYYVSSVMINASNLASFCGGKLAISHCEKTCVKFASYANFSNNNNIRLIRRCQNATCYNDMDRTVKKHEVTEQLDC